MDFFLSVQLHFTINLIKENIDRAGMKAKQRRLRTAAGNFIIERDTAYDR